MKLKAHRTRLEDGDGLAEAFIYPASNDAVLTVLSASENDLDGRSQFLWVRLSNGDLILGVFPQGDTYFAVEKYAANTVSRGGDVPDDS